MKSADSSLLAKFNRKQEVMHDFSFRNIRRYYSLLITTSLHIQVILFFLLDLYVKHEKINMEIKERKRW